MAGKITTNSVQLGDSVTATQNFVLQTNLDGTAKLSRGNLGATTQDVLTVDSLGKVSLLAPPTVPAQSMVRLNTANGYGSTNNKIRRFTNVATNQGADITYADSATLGASFTINTNGVYGINFSEIISGGYYGISLNSSQLTTSLQLINVNDILAFGTVAAVNLVQTCSTSIYLPSGAVIRAHTDGSASAGFCQFTITRVA